MMRTSRTGKANRLGDLALSSKRILSGCPNGGLTALDLSEGGMSFRVRMGDIAVEISHLELFAGKASRLLETSTVCHDSRFGPEFEQRGRKIVLSFTFGSGRSYSALILFQGNFRDIRQFMQNGHQIALTE